MYLKANQPVSLALALAADVVAVGTRRTDRTAADAVAPVDVVDLRELALTGPRTDNTQKIFRLVYTL